MRRNEEGEIAVEIDVQVVSSEAGGFQDMEEWETTLSTLSDQ